MHKARYRICVYFILFAMLVSCNSNGNREPILTGERKESNQDGVVKVGVESSKNSSDYQNASELIDEGKFKEAIIVYLKLCHIEEDGLKTNAYMGLGSAYYLAKDYPNAIKSFEKSLYYQDTNAESYVGLGSAYLTLRDYNKAILNYQAAKKINNNNSNCYWGLAVAYDELGKRDSAKVNARKFIELEPTSRYKPQLESILNK